MIRPSFNRPVLYTSLLSEQIRGVNGNHPVYSTIVADEYTMRTPDALLNGYATTNIIENCCPDFDDAKSLLFCDIQHLLASIKIATQGHSFDFDLVCPKCKSNDPYEANLQLSVPFLTARRWYTPLQIDDLVIRLKSPTYQDYSVYSMEEFRLTKQIYMVSSLNSPEVYGTALASLIEQKRSLVNGFYLSCIQSITINKKTVTSKKHIGEWFNECDGSLQKIVTDYIDAARKDCSLPDLQVTCSECSHPFSIPLDLDFCTHFRRKLIPASEEEVLKIISQMGEDTKSLTDDLLKMVWYMRGAISYSEAYNLTNFERKCIAKIIENNLEITKKTGLPII